MTLIIAATIVSAALVWLGERLRRPGDHGRAQLLTVLAEQRAAIAWSMARDASWDSLLAHTIKLIGSAPGRPTSSRVAIEAAAATALLKLGIKPNGRK